MRATESVIIGCRLLIRDQVPHLPGFLELAPEDQTPPYYAMKLSQGPTVDYDSGSRAFYTIQISFHTYADDDEEAADYAEKIRNAFADNDPVMRKGVTFVASYQEGEGGPMPDPERDAGGDVIWDCWTDFSFRVYLTV